MNFWWVNHKQTFRHEFRGGYVWSPKVRKNGSRNIFYDFMRLVRPGDLVFSYADGVIRGAGTAKSHCYTSPRPDEFGHIGEAWDSIGWRVDVRFVAAAKTVRPRDFLHELTPHIGVRHSPLNADGTGRQAVYLAAIPPAMGRLLTEHLGHVLTTHTLRSGPNETDIEIELPGIDEWEQLERRKIEQAPLPETERVALIKARIGQGLFKEKVSRYETHCRITNVSNPVHLIASHIKPWRESSNEERLSAGNGLLLTPTIDHLFDRGFITFEDSGDTLISPVADGDSLRRMGVDPGRPPRAGVFNSDQRHFLQHHRKSIFLADVSS
jgi:putative restriction endonuclease